MAAQYTCYVTSPLGAIEIKATDDFVTSVLFVGEEGVQADYFPPVVKQCQLELEEYFAGKLTVFTVAVQPAGTGFQTEVWNALKNIPYGETLSYTDIAVQLGKDNKSSRAVGLANGKNPVAIIIPCHRVIGENGKLTGYAGGAWRKEWLLNHEGKVSGKRLSLF